MNGTNEAREDARGKLLQHIKNFLVTNTIRQDPQVKAAVATVLARRRGESGHEDREQAMLQEMRDTPLEGSHHVAESAANIASIATSTSPLTLEIDDTNMHEAETSGAGNTTSSEQSKSMLPHSPNASDAKLEIMQDELAPLDPGELADTEGETPLDGAPAHNGHQHHQHHHKHSHGRGRSGSHLPKPNGMSLAESVDILSMSEVAEAKEAEGYEGDVEGNESGV
jgi:ATP/maltotriose-dependent transcriptional regulator MalT